MNRHRPIDQADREVSHIVQAWLMREAADAELTQARGSLKLGLGGHARRLKFDDDRPRVSIAELARSLYTDRPNLTKVVNSAADERITRLLDAVESDDSDALLAVYRDC